MVKKGNTKRLNVEKRQTQNLRLKKSEHKIMVPNKNCFFKTNDLFIIKVANTEAI